MNIVLYNILINILLLLTVLSTCFCDVPSFSFSTTSSEEDIQFPVPLIQSNESEPFYISISEPPPKKRGRRRKDDNKAPIQITTMHPRFIVIPSVIVFKADEVFWPYRVESDIIWPLKSRARKKIIDGNGTAIKAYENAGIVLRSFYRKGIKLGVMEQTKLAVKIIRLIKLFNLQVFDFLEVNKESEFVHMKRIQAQANVDFGNIVYVGTNETTLQDMEQLGVIVFKLKLGEGLQHRHIGEIIREFATRPYNGSSEIEDSVEKTEEYYKEENYNIYSKDIDSYIKTYTKSK